MTTAIVPYQDSSSLLTVVVDLYDVAVQAGEPFLPVNVQLAAPPAVLVVSGAFSRSGVLSVVVTKDGVSRSMQLNSGVALRAGCLYLFNHLANEGEEINYTYSVDCTADLFKVQTSASRRVVVSASNVYDFVTVAVLLAVMMAFGMALMKGTKT